MEKTSFEREEERIRFRRNLMSFVGGTQWLVHVSTLFGHNEKILGPGDFGLPLDLQQQLYKQQLLHKQERKPMVRSSQNTNITSLIEHKLSSQLYEFGTTEPIRISLWEDEAAEESLLGFILNMLGFTNMRRALRNNQLITKNGSDYTSLTILYSTETGYTLEGPSFQQINSRLDWSITELYTTITDRIRRKYDDSRGWESTLAEALKELDAL